jgi:conjugative relaxase-like TrwC/TraI family protein
VISVAVLAGGGAAGYYTRAKGCERELLLDLPGREAPGAPALERDLVDYYVNGRDTPGEWTGRGAQALRLVGRFGTGAGGTLQELLEGSHEGERLVPPVWRRDDAGVRVDVRRAGFDVTFSAPKSVSTLMALADPAVVGEVLTAHRQAAGEALSLLESLSARAARGHQGEGRRAPRIETDGFVGAAFTHTTSRALDPQLHTHVVIANLARGADGRWSALDSRTLHREAVTASYLYQHLLRANLTKRLGVSWTQVERGIAEIDGIPAQVRREFSTRRRQIEAALAQQPEPMERKGRWRQLAAQAACLATRPVKRHQPAKELRAQWAERASTAGFAPAQLQQLLDRPTPPRRELVMADVIERALGPEGITRGEATFGQGALLRELIGQLPPGADVSTTELLGLTASLVRTDHVLPVLTADGRAYTTRDHLQLEEQTLALAIRQDQCLAALKASGLAGTLVRSGRLRAEQQLLTFTLLTRGRPVEIVSGPPGCGKTAGLEVATEHWNAAGLEVRGTAVAALTAQGLEKASGAPSVSLARTLTRPDEHVPAGGVLLVDEAGMIGTRQLHHLLTVAQERSCKVVLVGDPQQLPELEAGGMFARLTQEAGALTLEGHHRQQNRWEREALHLLRIGDVPTALEAYRERGRLHTRHNPEDLHDAAVETYLTCRAEQPDPWQTVLLASSRDDVRALNAAVRVHLIARGQLSQRALEVKAPDGPVEFRAGDQVLVTRNDHTRGLLNGSTATITGLHRDGLTLRTSRGQQVRVPTGWLEQGRLDHGYAMTVHKAQGRTVHTALLVGGNSLSTQAGYVGLSRGTHDNYLFLDSTEAHDLTTDCSHAVQHRPAAPRPPGRQLERDSRQRLALDGRPARGVVHNLHRLAPGPDLPDVGRAGR